MTPEEFPGRMAFQRLMEAVGECIGREPEDGETLLTAQLFWQQLHGIVSLRISRPRFPWPPLAETVTEAVDRLLAGAASHLPPLGECPCSPISRQTFTHPPSCIWPG
jgi:Tetracyclin repressor-like, C-terminal domain